MFLVTITSATARNVVHLLVWVLRLPVKIQMVSGLIPDITDFFCNAYLYYNFSVLSLNVLVFLLEQI
jgi:hypothetical protein